MRYANTEKKENCIVKHCQGHDVIHWSNLHTILINVNFSEGMLLTLSVSDTDNAPV